MKWSANNDSNFQATANSPTPFEGQAGIGTLLNLLIGEGSALPMSTNGGTADDDADGVGGKPSSNGSSAHGDTDLPPITLKMVAYTINHDCTL